VSKGVYWGARRESVAEKVRVGPDGVLVVENLVLNSQVRRRNVQVTEYNKATPVEEVEDVGDEEGTLEAEAYVLWEAMKEAAERGSEGESNVSQREVGGGGKDPGVCAVSEGWNTKETRLEGVDGV
jgi:hypothetical protein